MGGARYASNISPSESGDESFVSAELENMKQLASDRAPPPKTSPLSSQPPPTSPPTGYFAPHFGSPSHELRSPLHRRPRPPASRSSHGIETLSGPPPALSTQRSYNTTTDSPWRNQPTADSATTPKPLPNRGGTDDSIDSILQASTSNSHDRRYSEPARVKDGLPSLTTTGKYGAAGINHPNNGHLVEEDQDHTLRINGQKLAMRRYMGPGNGDESHQASPEDLFLDLAKEDSVADDTSETMSRTERRLVSVNPPRDAPFYTSPTTKNSLYNTGYGASMMFSMAYALRCDMLR